MPTENMDRKDYRTACIVVTKNKDLGRVPRALYSPPDKANLANVHSWWAPPPAHLVIQRLMAHVGMVRSTPPSPGAARKSQG